MPPPRTDPPHSDKAHPPFLAPPANRQQQIVELEGLRLLLPLTESTDSEVQRLAAHALANLSVNGAPCRGVLMPQLCAYFAPPPPPVGLPKT